MSMSIELADRVTLIEGDLFAPLKDRRYDLILANPPYVDAEALAAFPPEYAAEPRMAHAGGADGLDIVRRILREATEHLTPEGHAGLRDRPAAATSFCATSPTCLSSGSTPKRAKAKSFFLRASDFSPPQRRPKRRR